MSPLVTLAHSVRNAIACFGRGWAWFWFKSRPTLPIEITRIGVGTALLIHYALATPYLDQLWGDAGWMPLKAALEDYDPWAQSVFYYFTAPWQLLAFHLVFLFCCAAFIVGWRTSWVKWVVLIGQLSYDHRNPLLSYGVDKILACLLFILCLAPIGRALSLDRVRAVRAAKLKDLDAVVPPYSSPWAGACTRLMQIQMAVLFFFSATSKLRGDDWWSGDAVWVVFTTNEHYNPLVLDVLARQYWIVNLATYGTILIELSYTFLVWQRRTRPFVLSGAIFLHAMFAFLMGLYYFSLVMTMGHMSFVRPRWLHALGAAWKRRIGPMEMIYDGRCGFCYRSMAWFLGFDGLAQITTRNFRTDPSPVVSDAQMEKALYLVLPDGRALPGFEAYRYVVARVPGMWWMAPFFYIPVLSRLVGHPVYNWVAAHRGRLSSLGIFSGGHAMRGQDTLVPHPESLTEK
jgi:predicted DCC family thiol-disulfide oxidoreductase YuxK